MKFAFVLRQLTNLLRNKHKNDITTTTSAKRETKRWDEKRQFKEKVVAPSELEMFYYFGSRRFFLFLFLPFLPFSNPKILSNYFNERKKIERRNLQEKKREEKRRKNLFFNLLLFSSKQNQNKLQIWNKLKLIGLGAKFEQ